MKNPIFMNSNLANQYFNNQLSESDELAFEQQLHHDMIKNRYEKLLQKEGLYVPKEPILKVVHRRFHPALKVAAILIVVSLAGWHVWKGCMPSKMSNFDVIAAQYLVEAAEIPQTRMGVTPQKEQNWAAFKQAYAAKEYGKAILLIQAIEPKDQDEYYYFGLCYLYQLDSEPVIAIQHLNTALKLGKKEAAWYLTLAHLKRGDKTAAKEVLQQFLALDLEWKRSEAEILLKNL
ncbi:MAG: hypothetical protein RL329_3235 [Bacteroidota bacterium]|jgi:hypothetical protein